MYDIEPLEQQWKQYRKKKLKPWYIGSLGLLVIIVPATIFLMNDKDFGKWKSYLEASKEIPSQGSSTKDSLDYKETNLKQSVLIEGALDRLEVKENIIDISDKVVKNSPNIIVDIPVLDDTKELFVEEVSQAKNKVHLEIIDSTNLNAYNDVEKRFLESHDLNDALFLARSYYKEGDYEKAIYWALEINKIDVDLEEGLLIFIKSKVKMGRKNEAISILTTYVKKSDSQEAKKLLFRIKNDKL